MSVEYNQYSLILSLPEQFKLKVVECGFATEHFADSRHRETLSVEPPTDYLNLKRVSNKLQ